MQLKLYKENYLENIKNDIGDFVESRNLGGNLFLYFENITKKIEYPIYRGLPLPLHKLYDGSIIEEWHNSSHWSKDINVAEKFARDYINEEYYEEVCKQLGLSEVMFVPVVMRLFNAQGVELHMILEEFEIEEYKKEQEVTLIGWDFTIIKIDRVKTRLGMTYRVDVEAKKRIKN